MDFPEHDPLQLVCAPGFDYDDFIANKGEYLDEWDREYIVEKFPVPYETLDEIKTAYNKGEITKDGAREFIMRKFSPIPKEATGIINSWAA